MTITSMDIDPELLAEAKRLLSASSNREAVQRALQYTISKERQILAFERIASRDFDDEQVNAPKIDY